jgi:thioredoxin 1
MIIINVTELNETNYNEFISEGISLVDLWAPWCKPCQVIAPIIDKLSSDYRDSEIKFGKLNADEHSDVVRELGVRNIPTILIYKNGEIVDKTVGMVSEAQLKEVIDNQLMLS